MRSWGWLSEHYSVSVDGLPSGFHTSCNVSLLYSQQLEETKKKKRVSEEQIVRILKEAEAAGTAREVIRKHNITEQTFYRWKN